MKQLAKRSIAYFLDCFICYSLVMLLIQWALLSNLRGAIGLTDEWFEHSWNLQLYVLLTISLPVWLYFTYFDSKKTVGTFGKRIMKLSVTDTQSERIGLKKSFIRTLLKLSPWEIAHIGVIFPTPLYFAENADVRVVTILGILLFGIYMVSILISPDGRSVYDKLLETKVIMK